MRLDFVALRVSPRTHGEDVFLIFHGLREVAGLGVGCCKSDEAIGQFPFGQFASVPGEIHRLVAVSDGSVRAGSKQGGEVSAAVGIKSNRPCVHFARSHSTRRPMVDAVNGWVSQPRLKSFLILPEIIQQPDQGALRLAFTSFVTSFPIGRGGAAGRPGSSAGAAGSRECRDQLAKPRPHHSESADCRRRARQQSRRPRQR